MQGLLVCRAEGYGDSLFLQQVLAVLGVWQQGTGRAGGIKEAGVHLAVAGQAGEEAGPRLQGVCQYLHYLDTWHVPTCCNCLRHLYPINPAMHIVGESCI